MAMPENLRQEVLNETNINVLKGLVLIADSVIATQATKLELLTQALREVLESTAESDQDALRYALLKLQLPAMMEIAAYAGSQSDEASGIFAQLDPLKLDSMLDAQLEAGVLEQLQDEFEAQAEAALDAQGEAESAPVTPTAEDGGIGDDTCGDEECPFCNPNYDFDGRFTLNAEL